MRDREKFVHPIPSAGITQIRFAGRRRMSRPLSLVAQAPRGLVSNFSIDPKRRASVTYSRRPEVLLQGVKLVVVKTRNLLIWSAITLILIVGGFAWFVASGGFEQLLRPDLSGN
jgi:hypothetical protein